MEAKSLGSKNHSFAEEKLLALTPKLIKEFSWLYFNSEKNALVVLVLFSTLNNKLFCVGGSYKNKISLKELTILCKKITNNKVNFTKIKKTSIYDIPYFITDISKVSKFYNWKPKKKYI